MARGDDSGRTRAFRVGASDLGALGALALLGYTIPGNSGEKPHREAATEISQTVAMLPADRENPRKKVCGRYVLPESLCKRSRFEGGKATLVLDPGARPDDLSHETGRASSISDRTH